VKQAKIKENDKMMRDAEASRSRTHLPLENKIKLLLK